MASENSIHITDPAGIGLVAVVALLFLAIRLLPRLLAGRGGYIDCDMLQQALQAETPPLLLDIRSSGEFHAKPGHIPASHLLPLPQLRDSLRHDIDFWRPWAQRRLVVICQSGARAGIAVYLLRRAGYPQACALAGGILAWEEENLPLRTAE